MPDTTRQPFDRMDQISADKECPSRAQQVFDNCGKCTQRVALHCSTCKIQVTGCMCSEIERFGEAEAVKRAFDRLDAEQARESLSKAGIILPPGFKP